MVLSRMPVVTESFSESCNSTPEYVELARIKFQLGLNEFLNDSTLKKILLEGIKCNNMAPYYKRVCRELNWRLDESLYGKMHAVNLQVLETLSSPPVCEGLENYAKGNWRRKLEYFCSIGDIDVATDFAFSITTDHRNSTNCRAEASFYLFRLGFLNNSISAMRVAIGETASAMDGECGSGVDRCSRNKLKIYQAIYYMAIRNYKRAATLLLDSIPTFESYELLPFNRVVRYTILAATIALPRSELQSKLNDNGTLSQALVTECPAYKDYLATLYQCHYAEFFINLSKIELEMRADPLLHRHYRHYVREMRIVAYSQILKTHRSLTLERMALEFGVTTSYMEQEVARCIARGRLRCKIDKVAGCVVTRSEAECDTERASEACCERGIIYQSTIKNGDDILNQLADLATVVDL